MIALVPQTEQRHRSANGLAALAPQSQLVSGCFAMAFLVLPAHRICRIIAIPFSILTCKVCLSPTMSVRGENVHPVDRKVFERMELRRLAYRARPLPISCDVLPANPARAPYGSH